MKQILNDIKMLFVLGVNLIKLLRDLSKESLEKNVTNLSRSSFLCAV